MSKIAELRQQANTTRRRAFRISKEGRTDADFNRATALADEAEGLDQQADQLEAARKKGWVFQVPRLHWAAWIALVFVGVGAILLVSLIASELVYAWAQLAGSPSWPMIGWFWDTVAQWAGYNIYMGPAAKQSARLFHFAVVLSTLVAIISSAITLYFARRK